MSLSENDYYLKTGKYPHNMTKDEYADIAVKHYEYWEWDLVQSRVIEIRERFPKLDYDKTRAGIARRLAYKMHDWYIKSYNLHSPEMKKRFYKNEV